MKLPPKMPQRAMVRIWVASLHQEVQHPNRVLDFLFCRNFFRAERVDSNSIGPPYSPAGKKATVGLF